jgi:hypothetical protein
MLEHVNLVRRSISKNNNEEHLTWVLACGDFCPNWNPLEWKSLECMVPLVVVYASGAMRNEG